MTIDQLKEMLAICEEYLEAFNTRAAGYSLQLTGFEYYQHDNKVMLLTSMYKFNYRFIIDTETKAVILMETK